MDIPWPLLLKSNFDLPILFFFIPMIKLSLCAAYLAKLDNNENT